jgi:hypothetical protein
MNRKKNPKPAQAATIENPIIEPIAPKVDWNIRRGNLADIKNGGCVFSIAQAIEREIPEALDWGNDFELFMIYFLDGAFHRRWNYNLPLLEDGSIGIPAIIPALPFILKHLEGEYRANYLDQNKTFFDACTPRALALCGG